MVRCQQGTAARRRKTPVAKGGRANEEYGDAGAKPTFTASCVSSSRQLPHWRRPSIASAAAKTATVWWAQGFVPEEDDAFKEMVAAYEKQSGNKIDYSIVPFAPLRQKIVSAIT